MPSIKLLHLHDGQREVVRNRRRFNVVNCGRRWGKTTLAVELMLENNGAIDGKHIAYFAPTYKMMMEVWRELCSVCAEVIKDKSEQEKRIELITGGTVSFWSMDAFNSARGRKYHRAIVDEAAISTYLKEAWENVIRGTLVDYRGDAFFFSTPKGKNNYFHRLHEIADGDDGTLWAYFHMPSDSNPHISADEIAAAQRMLDPLTFAQEYLASFVTSNLDAWAYAFNAMRHVGSTVVDRTKELYISFDFNRDPISCAIFQHYNGRIYGIECVKLNNSNIYSLCDYILAKYPRFLYIITGDATGKASTALVRDNVNYYTVIKSKLNLSTGQMKVPAINPTLVENRILVNSVLHNCEIVLDKDNCKHLIFDLENARVLPDGSLDKTDRKDPTKQLDALDCMRYYLNTFHRHILKNIN